MHEVVSLHQVDAVLLSSNREVDGGQHCVDRGMPDDIGILIESPPANGPTSKSRCSS
jgi:hypothetical protein